LEIFVLPISSNRRINDEVFGWRSSWSYDRERVTGTLAVVNELKLNLESIVSEFYAPVYRFALSLARNESEAADLTQQTFFILAQRSHQIRDFSKVKCWLFTTLRREFLRGARHQSNHPEVEFLPDHHDSPIVDSAALRLADARIVLEALKNVDETYRTALELFYLGELSYREIAGILEIPIGTVMSRLSRGKEQLKALLTTAIAQNQSKIIQLPRDARASK
jgi:RNA polymerase sigma-70 factor (ECF subfamily)